MKEAIAQCTNSTGELALRKEQTVPRVSSRLVNLQAAGANLVSLGEGRKKGSVRGRKRKLIRSDSSGATEFSLRQILARLQSLYSEYKAVLEGRTVRSAGVAAVADLKKAEEAASRRRTPVYGKRISVEPRVDVGKVLNELNVGSTATKKETSLPWKEDREFERRSTISIRPAAKAGRVQQSEESSFKRSYTLPGHFHGKRGLASLSVREKAAAFSQVTEGTGLAAPYGLSSRRTRRASFEGGDLEIKLLENKQKAEVRETTTLTAEPETSVRPFVQRVKQEKPVRPKSEISAKPVVQRVKTEKPVRPKSEVSVRPIVQTAIVRTVITNKEPAKRVSLLNIDVNQVQAAEPSSPSVSPGPLTRVVSPSSVILPSEQEPPPRVVSPVLNRRSKEQEQPPKVVSPIPIVVSPVLNRHSKEQEQPPKVVSPVPIVVSPVLNRRSRESPSPTAAPVSQSKAAPSSKSSSLVAHKSKTSQRRSIQNLKMAGKVSHLKHVFDRREENGAGGRGSAGKSPTSRSPSPKLKPAERVHSPTIIPKVAEPELELEQVVLSEPLMADRRFPTPDIAPKENTDGLEQIQEESFTGEEGEQEKTGFLAPPRPEPPQNYTSASPSPELFKPENPPPRPPSPIGYILERECDTSDGESSYQSYDTDDYSDEEEEEEEEEDGEGEGEEGEGEEGEGEEGEEGTEEIDSGKVERKTLKSLQ